MQVAGTYFNGQLKLEKPIKTRHPLKVVVHFIEETEELPVTLKLTDFSFLETQALLKEYKGSFSDEVVEERRSAQ